MKQSFAIVFLCVTASVVYGVVHDQITARICVEYFTIGHPQVIGSRDPTLLGLVWGIIATWWVGLLTGVPLTIAARVGSRPQISAGSLVRPVVILLGCTALFAVTAGTIGYVAASNGWIWLVGRLAVEVPPEKHVGFLTDLWAHTASYVGAFVGGSVLIVWVRRSRGAAMMALDEESSGR